MKGPINYIGGKNRLASTIIPLIPDHITYIEPFAGGAQILFHKERSKVEVLNDVDGDLVNCYCVIQQHYPEMLRCMQHMLSSREWFDRLKNTNPKSLTDIQRAVRYFYLQKIGYGGLVTRHNYAAHVLKRANFSVPRAKELIKQTHDRLQDVHIEHLPYEEVLKKYDKNTSFFYCDPPYYGIPAYTKNLEHDDFVALASNLKAIQGKFLLSLNDTPQTRQIFSGFTITEVPVTYSVNNKTAKRVVELLIKNY